jgi:putative oxidoreductase
LSLAGIFYGQPAAESGRFDQFYETDMDITFRLPVSTGVKRGDTMSLNTQNSSHPALSCADGLAAGTADLALLIGRILLGWIFVRSGYGKLFDIAGYAATFPPRGLPEFLAYISVPVEFLGGIAVMLGLATRYVVLVMIVFMLVATFSSHRYWEVADLKAQRIQDANFYKNMAMLGGFFFLFVCGGGRFSLDGWLRKRG